MRSKGRKCPYGSLAVLPSPRPLIPVRAWGIIGAAPPATGGGAPGGQWWCSRAATPLSSPSPPPPSSSPPGQPPWKKGRRRLKVEGESDDLGPYISCPSPSSCARWAAGAPLPPPPPGAPSPPAVSRGSIPRVGSFSSLPSADSAP